MADNTNCLDLTDTAFLDDYLTFGVWQPAYMANWLYRQAESATDARACFALQIFMNMEFALEALAKWCFTLRDWKLNGESLLWRFKNTEVKEAPNAAGYTTSSVLAMIETSTDEEILHLLKQPSDSQLMSRGWRRREVIERSKWVGDLLKGLRAGLQNRIGGDRNVVRAYNNLKHGLLVVRQLPGGPGADTSAAVYLMARVTKSEGDRSLVEPLGLHCDPAQLDPLRKASIGTCKLVVSLLGLVPWYYYTSMTWNEYQAQPDTAVGAIGAIIQEIDNFRSGP